MSEEFSFPHVVVGNDDYRKETVAKYRGNPFIEALPPLPADTALQGAVTNLPSFETMTNLLKLINSVYLGGEIE